MVDCSKATIETAHHAITIGHQLRHVLWSKVRRTESDLKVLRVRACIAEGLSDQCLAWLAYCRLASHGQQRQVARLAWIGIGQYESPQATPRQERGNVSPYAFQTDNRDASVRKTGHCNIGRQVEGVEQGKKRRQCRYQLR
jgi:hypothetical protein